MIAATLNWGGGDKGGVEPLDLTRGGKLSPQEVGSCRISLFYIVQGMQEFGNSVLRILLVYMEEILRKVVTYIFSSVSNIS